MKMEDKSGSVCHFSGFYLTPRILARLGCLLIITILSLSIFLLQFHGNPTACGVQILKKVSAQKSFYVCFLQ